MRSSSDNATVSDSESKDQGNINSTEMPIIRNVMHHDSEERVLVA